MSSHGSFASMPQPNSGSGLESPIVQPWESLDPPTTHEELTVRSIVPTHTHGGSRRIRDRAALTRWELTDPREFLSSRITRPKCAPTAELFGHLPDYLRYAHPSPQGGEDDSGDDDDYDLGTPTQDDLSPLKERQRKRLRESAGVKPKPSQKRTAGPSSLKSKISLPPAGRMKCLWGGGCTVQMPFDYTLDTIKDWKNHIASHLAKSDKSTDDSAGRNQKMKVVKCGWDGCGAKVERGYLFKHIVTHEMRFKLLCPRGCEVAIRDDNLDRHLRSCRLGDQ